ncbi:MAG: hypothetical protein RIR43_46 [Pseudomonadota bacterium]
MSTHVWLSRQLRRARRLTALVLAGLQDIWGYARGSGLLNDDAPAARLAQVLKTAHRLDKGLALPEPRAGFGAPVARLLQLQLATIDRSHWAWQQGCAALERHQHFSFGSPALELSEPQTRAAVLKEARGDFGAVVRSRRSVRQFDGSPLSMTALWRAVELARHSPSACNRSGARVWVAVDAPVRERLLRHQDGHQGFADRASAVALVTVDTSVFHTVGERHQAWVDGGLFAMTLVYALHFEGLGTCCLNWSVEPKVDRALKRSCGVPPGEAVVMMVAIGGLPAHYTVAHSPRRPVHEVFRILDKSGDCVDPEAGEPEA